MIVFKDDIISLTDQRVTIPNRELVKFKVKTTNQSIYRSEIVNKVSKQAPKLQPKQFTEQGLDVIIDERFLELCEYNSMKFFLGEGFTVCNREGNWEVIFPKNLNT